jgi:Uma2 family endonuclease
MTVSIENLNLQQNYTYADYLTWQFEHFVELLRGKIMPMSAPSRIHQKVCLKLASRIETYLEMQKCPCEVYVAPFDVRLVKNREGKTDKDVYTVVQPDVSLICDLSKLDERGCFGAPDLIIEIISENNAKRDLKDKFELYEENGVREYWIVRPSEKTIQQFFLENDRFAYKNTFSDDDQVSPIVLPELTVVLSEVFNY